MAMADWLGLGGGLLDSSERSRGRSRSKEGRSTERSSSSKAAAILTDRRAEVSQVVGFFSVVEVKVDEAT